ncbi:hypothetical protein DFP73DRAFT_524453 [Morchella snyderi]|nr:hypothetical protein DFP73DRAFT_524453 [Morchella snyderi]
MPPVRTADSLKCPCCSKQFGGTTARNRLNTHCKEKHLEYYRASIRPLKSTKDINRDAYLRQKEKNPEKVRKDRILARLRKKARDEQIDCIMRSQPVSPPPQPGSTDIDPSNPYFVVEYSLRIFAGSTVGELLAFDVVSALQTSLDTVENTLKNQITNALYVARTQPLPGLVYKYDLYKQALRDTEFYQERLDKYEKLKDIQESKMLMPENFVDDDLVQRRVQELYQQFLTQPRRSHHRSASSGTESPSPRRNSAPSPELGALPADAIDSTEANTVEEWGDQRSAVEGGSIDPALSQFYDEIPETLQGQDVMYTPVATFNTEGRINAEEVPESDNE